MPMLPAKPAVLWRSLAVTFAALAFASSARAQVCQSARPTDPEGSAGVSYGAAQVAFVDAASGRARVHYALSGPHAVPRASTLEPGVPDAAVVAARAADDALAKYEELGYQAPLSDGDSPCASHGGSEAVDIYLVNFAAADGQALTDHCEVGSPERCAGFVMVENDFRGGGYADLTEGMRTVVPHELFHLVQNAYDANVERWWAEGSAQWAAQQVFPELRDLERFLPTYFTSPWRPLNVPPSGVITNFLYATAIWPVFLHERFDASVVRQVYEGAVTDNDGVLPVTDRALRARGSSLAEEFLAFASYNAATGARAPDVGGYGNAASYPEVKLTRLDPSKSELVSDVVAGLGAFYYAVSAAAPTELSLDADRDRVAAVWLPLVGGRVQVKSGKALPTSVDGDGVVVVAGQSLARTDAPFTLRAGPGTAETGARRASTSPGCSWVGSPPSSAAGGAALGFVLMLVGRCRVRSRPRKGR